MLCAQPEAAGIPPPGMAQCYHWYSPHHIVYRHRHLLDAETRNPLIQGFGILFKQEVHMLKTIFIIISGILILYLLLRLRSRYRAIHTMTLELKEMNREEPVHRHLQIPVPDKELELLAEEINRYLTQSFSRSYAQKA